jgi:hypothetical protein
MKPSFLVVPALVLLMSACGGGESDDQVNDYLDNNSSQGCEQEFADRMPASTRSQAASDVQCTSYVAAADNYLAQARSYCASGNRSYASQAYTNYLTSKDYAVANVEMLCGGDSGGAIVPDDGGSGSASGDITLYVQYSTDGSGRVLGGRCTNMGAPADGNGTYWYAAAQNLTMDECTAKGAEYGLSFN